MIQIVTYSGREQKYNGDGFEQYSLHDIKSLDEYEFTIIDLGDSYLWRNNGTYTTTINKIEDLCSISEMIMRSETSKIILILPQNVVFNYDYWANEKKYHSSKEIKNMIKNVTSEILSKIYQPIKNIHLIYENTTTEIGDIECEASFYFADVSDVIFKSKKSNKPTTIKMEKAILTTLLFKDSSEIMKFLSEMGVLEVKSEMPEWLDEISMFDDIEQKELISKCQDVIDNMQEKIMSAESTLAANDRMKVSTHS